MSDLGDDASQSPTPEAVRDPTDHSPLTTRPFPDPFTPAERSAVMRAVKSSGTTPELKVRALLTQLGARYRLQRKDLPGAPDIVLPGRKLAIFVHGCFWHGHDCRRGARAPKQNAAYWSAKIARNRARDACNLQKLHALGWLSEVVWECELKRAGELRARMTALLHVPAPAVSS